MGVFGRYTESDQTTAGSRENRMYPLSVLIIAMLVAASLVSGEMEEDEPATRAESRLRKDLFQNYERELLPKINKTDVLNITYGVFLKRLDPHKNFKVTVLGTFMFNWKDDYLVYADKNPQKIKSLRVMTHEIWVRDLKLLHIQIARLTSMFLDTRTSTLEQFSIKIEFEF